jgi:hypothetical protein
MIVLNPYVEHGRLVQDTFDHDTDISSHHLPFRENSNAWKTTSVMQCLVNTSKHTSRRNPAVRKTPSLFLINRTCIAIAKSIHKMHVTIFHVEHKRYFSNYVHLTYQTHTTKPQHVINDTEGITYAREDGVSGICQSTPHSRVDNDKAASCQVQCVDPLEDLFSLAIYLRKRSTLDLDDLGAPHPPPPFLVPPSLSGGPYLLCILWKRARGCSAQHVNDFITKHNIHSHTKIHFWKYIILTKLCRGSGPYNIHRN